MDSDDDYLYDATDSGNESPEGEESDGGMQDEVGRGAVLNCTCAASTLY